MSAKAKSTPNLNHGAKCQVMRGVHKGKTGYVAITVVQSNGNRFKTLAKNVVVKAEVQGPMPQAKWWKAVSLRKAWL